MLQTTLSIVAAPQPGPEPAAPPSSGEPAPAPGGGFAQALRDAGAPDANTEPVRADGGDNAQREETRRHDGAAPEHTAIERRQAATRGQPGARRDGAARTGDTPTTKAGAETAVDAAAGAARAATARASVDRRDAATPAEEEDAVLAAGAGAGAVVAEASLTPMADPLVAATAPATASTPPPETTAGKGSALIDGEAPVRRRSLDAVGPRGGGGGRPAQGAPALRESAAGINPREDPIDAPPGGVAALESRTEAAPPAAPRELLARASRESLDMSANAALPASVARFDSAGGPPRAAPAMLAMLDAPVGSREFAPALGAQVAVWVRDGVHEARLQLHPAELGPLAIQIALDGHSAQIDFHAAHALTRDAIEASLPALAASLRESGFTLAGGGVFGQGAGGAAGERGDAPGRDSRPLPQQASEPTVGAPLAEPPARGWRRGLLDVFA